MLKRLQKQITDKISAWSTSDVQRLESLGFSNSQAQIALRVSDGNVDRAAEYLLSGGAGAAAGNAGTSNTSGNNNNNGDAMLIDDDEDYQLQQALEASRIAEGQRQTRTAAMNKAAEAAMARHQQQQGGGKKKKATTKKATTTTTTNKKSPPPTRSQPTRQISANREALAATHPNVKLVPKLQDKSLAEKIERTTLRLAKHHQVVDALHVSLTLSAQGVYENLPKSQLAGATGAADLLRAMGYREGSRDWAPPRSHDATIFTLGLSALEQTQASDIFKTAKLQDAFTEETKRYFSNPSAAEVARRKTFANKLPREPNSGALLTINVGGSVLRRKFEGDDTVADIYNYIGSQSTILFDKLRDGTYQLVDRNKRGKVVKFSEMDTLQYVELWPAGRLVVEPC